MRFAKETTVALAALFALLPSHGLRAEPSRSQDATGAYVEGLIRSLETKEPEARHIGLAEAVVASVANNPGILADRREPEATAYDVLGAESVYEPKILIDFFYENREIPTSDLLSGVDEPGQGAEPLEGDDYLAEVTLTKLLRTGTRVDLSVDSTRRTTNSGFEALSPRFDPSLGIGVEQSLLRDFGGYSARTTVALAENTSLQSAAGYEAELAVFVLDVVRAYWSYALAEAELRSQERSFDLASELAEEAEARVKIGTLPPVAAKEAASDAASREEGVISARNDLELAARELQYKVMFGTESGGAPVAIRPGEFHEVTAVSVETAAILRTAVDRRAEVRNARLDVANAKLSTDLNRNLLLPSLDLFGRYEWVGLGGLENSDFDSGGNVVSNSSDEWDAYGDAWDLLDDGDFFRYRIGVELEVPLSNAEARSRYTQATIELKRAQEDMKQVVSDIALEIQQAAGDVASAYKRVQAAKLARELAEENLRDQQKRYEVGIVTTTDILDFQEKATNAMASEARATADHAIALARLKQAEGTLLDDFGIRVAFEDKPGKEWWSRF
jgi:outer membrane protein TolC